MFCHLFVFHGNFFHRSELKKENVYHRTSVSQNKRLNRAPLTLISVSHKGKGSDHCLKKLSFSPSMQFPSGFLLSGGNFCFLYIHIISIYDIYIYICFGIHKAYCTRGWNLEIYWCLLITAQAQRVGLGASSLALWSPFSIRSLESPFKSYLKRARNED